MIDGERDAATTRRILVCIIPSSTFQLRIIETKGARFDSQWRTSETEHTRVVSGDRVKKRGETKWAEEGAEKGVREGWKEKVITRNAA